MHEQETTGGYRLYQLIGLVAGPVAFAVLFFSPPPSGLPPEGWSVAALAVWMAVWWATEALPRRCQSKILNTWSGHRTAQIDPEKCRKINGHEIRF